MNLHSIIEAATPGPWVRPEPNHGTVSVLAHLRGGDGNTPVCIGYHARPFDLRHIATFDPTLAAAMLAVCEAVAAVRGHVATAHTMPSNEFSDKYVLLEAQRDSALCALESLLTERGLMMGEE